MITGFDQLQRRLKELAKAVSSLDGELTTVSFDPEDPQSIELAIQKMEAAIDERVGNTGDNDTIQSIVNEIKEKYRQAILERASEARGLSGDHQ